MSAPVTLGAIVAGIQQRANIENFTGFISAAEVRGYANEELAELWDLLMSARAQEHMRRSSTITTVSGTSAYSIPTDMEQLISVDYQYAAGQYQAIRPYMESERNMFRFFPAAAGWYYGQPVYYRIQGATNLQGVSITQKQINFIPTPQAAYTVILNYYPVFVPFATDGTADAQFFEGVNGWEGYAIWGAAATCKAKLKEDPSFCLGKKGEYRARIEELAAQNDAGQAERIQDVATYDYGWWGHW